MIDLSEYLNWAGIGTAMVDQFSSSAGIDFQSGGPQGASISFTRGASTIAAQQVVLTPISGQPEQTFGPPSQERKGTVDLVLTGVRNHPTRSDFNVQRGDRFRVGTARYEVVLVDTSLNGRTEARCIGIQ